MSTLRDIPTSYDEALAFLNGKDSRNCGYVTTVERVENGIGVKQHHTIIGVFHPDHTLTIDTKGWHSTSTKSRLNRLLRNSAWRIWNDRGAMTWHYYHSNKGCEKVTFEDGDRVFLGRGKGCAIWQEFGK